MFRCERVHCPKTVGAATAAETEAKAEAEADNYKASKALRNLFACPAAAEGSGSGSGREAASSSIDLNWVNDKICQSSLRDQAIEIMQNMVRNI